MGLLRKLTASRAKARSPIMALPSAMYDGVPPALKPGFAREFLGSF